MRFCILQDIKTPILPIFRIMVGLYRDALNAFYIILRYSSHVRAFFFRHGLRAVGAHYTVLFDAEQLVTTSILKNIEYSLS